MQIVIDIPKKEYDVIVNQGYIGVKDCHVSLSSVIKNGIPLPNGHGNLKDVDSIFNEGFPNADINSRYEENMKKYPLWRTSITGFQSILKNAPTIIEADKAESEEDLDNLDSMLEDLWNATESEEEK